MSPTKQAVNGFPRAQTGAPQPYHSARAPEREIGDPLPGGAFLLPKMTNPETGAL